MPEKPIQSLTGRTIRCILFDLGDTLWYRGDTHNWERLETAANLRAVVLIRAHISPELLPPLDDRALGRHLRETFDDAVRAFIQRHPGIEADGSLAVIYALQQWGIDCTDRSLATAIFEALRVRIPESRPLFEDALPTLAALQQRGFLLGAVSNRLWGGKQFQEDVQSIGLFNYFHPRSMAISADLGVRKPDPAIFLHALRALDVAPEHTVMVGDSLRADIAGALSLGIFTIWKPKPGLRDHIRVHAGKTGTSSGRQVLNEAPPEPGTQLGGSPPPGMYVTDDDYILAQMQSRDSLDQFFSGAIKPDLIIEHLSDLLDIFLEVRVQ